MNIVLNDFLDINSIYIANISDVITNFFEYHKHNSNILLIKFLLFNNNVTKVFYVTMTN